MKEEKMKTENSMRNFNKILFSFLPIFLVIIFSQKNALATFYTINIPIEGSQEVPPSPSTGLGVLNGTYNSSTFELSFYINFTGLWSPTVAAHFHGPAMPGVNALVQIGLVGFPNGNTGGYGRTYILTADQNTQILSGLWYVNIHTHDYPAGEIRGQLNLYPHPTPPPDLSSPANNSTNNPLSITFIWNKVNTALSYRLQVSTDSLFFSLLVNDSTLIDSFKTISGFNYQTKYFWRVGSKYSTGTTSYSSGWKFTTISMSIVSLKLLMEGMYNSVTNLLSRKDTVTLHLRNAVFPYVLRDSVKRVIDSTTFSALFTFPGIPTGQYYLVAKHHNCIETWSRIDGEPLVGNGTIYNYDFTFSKGRAFGQNMIQVDTSPNKFAIYSGDVNQDGTIDAGDLSEVENDALNSVSGYIPTDVTGDDYVDAGDLSIVENNASLGVNAVIP